MKDKLIEFFKAYDSIQETGKTWEEVGLEFNMTGESARAIIRRHKNKLQLTSQTEKNGAVVFETFKKVPDSITPDLSNFDIAKVTTNPYGGQWVTYDKTKPAITKQDITEVYTELYGLKFNLTTNYEIPKSDTVQIINIADCHLGMDVSNDLYNYKWNISEFYNRLDIVISNINYNCETLVINQLGDFADNLDNYTARKDHRIPSNMNSREIIKEGIASIIYLVDQIKARFNGKIVINWLCNSNHAPLLDFAIGVALKGMCTKAQVNVVEDFFYSFKVNDLTFLAVHGKDSSFMSKGLSRNLSDKEINELRNYIDYNNLQNVVLLRGDLHCYQDIQYENFRDMLTPSFANPSAWIQYNFKSKYRGGFSILDISNNDIKTRLINF